MNKKSIIKVFIILICFIFLVGCDNKKLNFDKDFVKKVTKVSEFEKIFKSEETNIIVLGQTTCPHCVTFKQSANKVATDKEIVIYWIEIDQLSQPDRQKLIKLHKRFEEISTPLTIITKNGDIIDEMLGDQGVEPLEIKLRDHGIIE